MHLDKSSAPLFTLLVAACLPCAAQPPIKGVVSTTRGEGIEGVSVTLQLRSQGSRILLTDSKGAFTFSGIGTGSYELTFEREGFTPAVRQVTLTYDDDSGNLNVTLVREGEAQGSAHPNPGERFFDRLVGVIWSRPAGAGPTAAPFVLQ